MVDRETQEVESSGDPFAGEAKDFCDSVDVEGCHYSLYSESAACPVKDYGLVDALHEI